MVGLFAIPQVLSMIEKKQLDTDQFQMEKKSVVQSIIFNISRIKALVVGSVSGVIIGKALYEKKVNLIDVFKIIGN